MPDLSTARPRWEWLLTELGYEPFQAWEHGCSFRLGATYLVLEQFPALDGDRHERRRPGVNHLAMHAGSPEELDELVSASSNYGWHLMFPDQHPFVGGLQHRAAYLEDNDGYEVGDCPCSG